jgi:hypothetical protein
MLDRNKEDTQIQLVPNEVQGDFILSSNSVSSSCTSLGVNEQEELLLDSLADLLVDIYLYAKRKRN